MNNMRKHRTYTVLSILCALILALSGCTSAATSTAASTSQETAATSSQTAATDASATYVQVQSIQDGTITAIIGTMTQPTGQPGETAQEGSTPQGTPPEMPSSDSTQQGTPPEQPSGDNQQGTPPEMPSGDSTQQGQGAPGGMMGFTAGEAVITFSVNDTTIVTRQNGPETAEAAISDIAAGDILAVTLSSDNTAEAIVIQSAGGMGDPAQTSGQPGSSFGGSSTVTNGTAATTTDADGTVSTQTYTSDGDDKTHCGSTAQPSSSTTSRSARRAARRPTPKTATSTA
jgi:hypothetical protein